MAEQSKTSAADAAPPSRRLRGAGLYAEALAAAAFLHPGQLMASADGVTITTIVGSCVSVCFFDPARRAGGANHYVLPMAGAAGVSSARFGDVAIPELMARMLALGCDERRLVAKLFGGASVLLPSDRSGAESLGSKNARIARQLLAARGVPLVAEDVGGTRGRKVVFRTDTGDAWVRRL
jgi:chemotaxis protein CheD